MATIHVVGGEKGGVGKSMFARVLLHYFQTNNIDVAAITPI